MNMIQTGLVLASPLLAVFTSSVAAVQPDQASLALRLRHEQSMQDNALRDAQASTLRYRLGLTSQAWHGLTGLLETEGVVALGDEDYNSGPGGNGHTQYSVVADPTGNEVNQAYLNYAFGQGSLLRAGRQRIIFDNARFVGNVGWRQNEQTYDAALLKLGAWEGGSLSYAYLRTVNRIFFDNVDLDGHLLNLHSSLGKALSASLYAYLLDYDNGEDSQTVGLRLAGASPAGPVKLSYTAEFAHQSEYADASDIDTDYSAFSAGVARGGLGLTLGSETLGGDGSRGFSTPLATLHKFNGFADMFLATPASGLVDLYAKLAYGKGKWSGAAFYHQFSADTGSADFGTEVDAVLKYAHSKKQSLLLKFADYSADTHGVDTRKLTLDINYAL